MRQRILFAGRHTHQTPAYAANVEILAPTLLEYWAVRLALPYAHPRWAGVRLARWRGADQASTVIVCGLAGALAPDLSPGSVLIPEQVGLIDGSSIQCDSTLVQALTTAAQTLDFPVQRGPLLTAPSLIVGDERQTWFQRGFVAVDMETGLLARQGRRVATVRVVLDSPEHGIAPDWLHPARALFHPRLWRELLWLSQAGPRYALRAAHIVKSVSASSFQSPQADRNPIPARELLPGRRIQENIIEVKGFLHRGRGSPASRVHIHRKMFFHCCRKDRESGYS